MAPSAQVAQTSPLMFHVHAFIPAYVTVRRVYLCVATTEVQSVSESPPVQRRYAHTSWHDDDNEQNDDASNQAHSHLHV